MKKTAINTTFVKNLMLAEAFAKDGGEVIIRPHRAPRKRSAVFVNVELIVGSSRGEQWGFVGDGKTLPAALNKAVKKFNETLHDDERLYNKVYDWRRTMRVLDEVLGLL